MAMTDAEFTAFSDWCQQACKSLPDGWRVSIQLENGSGWADLFNPKGDLRDTGPVDCDESIPECGVPRPEGSLHCSRCAVTALAVYC